MDVRSETPIPIHVARIRHVGPIAEVGPCFERIFRWAAAIGVPTGRILTLSHDDPARTPADRLRSDACVELRIGEEPAPGIVLGPVGGGRYALNRHKGPYVGIAAAYARQFDEWLPAGGETMADRPCMELYQKTPKGGRLLGARKVSWPRAVDAESCLADRTSLRRHLRRKRVLVSCAHLRADGY